MMCKYNKYFYSTTYFRNHHTQIIKKNCNGRRTLDTVSVTDGSTARIASLPVII